MTLITKGMGIIMKKGGGDLLKKSKKFPGPKSDEQLQKKQTQELDVEKEFEELKDKLVQMILTIMQEQDVLKDIETLRLLH